jgi:transporter family-2 protein
MAVGTGGLGLALSNLGGQPLWRFAGGLLGAGAIFCTVMLTPRLGLATLLALVIAGQLLASITIDNFGLLGVIARSATVARLLGAVVMLLGVLIALFGDRVYPHGSKDRLAPPPAATAYPAKTVKLISD